MTVQSEIAPSSVARDVGRRIRELRMGHGERMTQEDLSARADISVSFLSMIERGERSPHLETLASLAHALQVRIADLFLETDESGVEPKFRPLIDACRKHNLGKRDVDRLIGVVRTMFA
jgi:transcriptional regulator with XRE-family HTH domain